MTEIIPSTVKMRCSSLPLVAQCGQSAQVGDDGVIVGGDRHAGDEGTAAHEVLTGTIRRAEQNPRDSEIESSARKHRIPAEDVRTLTWKGWRAWEGLAPLFPEPATEKALGWINDDEGVELTGHADVLSITREVVACADFKSGRLEINAWDQLQGYGFLALRERPDLDRAWLGVIEMRDQVVDGRWYTREQLDHWYAGILRSLRDPTFRHGDHCIFCPRAANCPGGRAWLSQAAGSLIGFQEGVLPDDPEELAPVLADLVGQARTLSKVCDRIIAIAKAGIAAVGGSMPIGDGREMRLTPQKRSDILFAQGFEILMDRLAQQAAWILRDRMSEEDRKRFFDALARSMLATCINVGKTRAEESVKNMAGDGQKAAAWREVLYRLEQAGATNKYEIAPKLEIKKITKQIGART